MRYPDGSFVTLSDVVDGGDGEATVIRIADSGEYAPAFQPPGRLNCDAGVLVVFHDGTLKWRPLPGMPLRLCRRPTSGEIRANDLQGTHTLPVTAIPAYHGFYVDGQRIELPDVVQTSNEETAKVVAIVSENLYSPDFRAEN